MKLFNHSILLSMYLFSFSYVFASQVPLMPNEAATHDAQQNLATPLELSDQSQAQPRAQNRHAQM